MTPLLLKLLIEFLLPVPTTESPTGLGILVPREGILPLEHAMVPLNRKMRQPPGHIELFMLVNQQVAGGGGSAVGECNLYLSK